MVEKQSRNCKVRRRAGAGVRADTKRDEQICQRPLLLQEEAQETRLDFGLRHFTPAEANLDSRFSNFPLSDLGHGLLACRFLHARQAKKTARCPGRPLARIVYRKREPEVVNPFSSRLLLLFLHDHT